MIIDPPIAWSALKAINWAGDWETPQRA